MSSRPLTHALYVADSPGTLTKLVHTERTQLGLTALRAVNTGIHDAYELSRVKKKGVIKRLQVLLSVRSTMIFRIRKKRVN